MAPRVTVLMSVYNDERHVGKAVESILNQTFTDFEFLIVNDGSTDRSREIVMSHPDPRIRLIDNGQNIGLTKSLNRGLSLARGELVARFDSNDVSFRNRLQEQVAFMDQNPEVAVLGTQIDLIDVDGRNVSAMGMERPVTFPGVKWYLMFGSAVNHTSAMYRRNVVWEECRGYDETFTVAQDAELWFRVVRSHVIANLPTSQVAVRVDPLSISGNSARPIRSGHADRMSRLLESSMEHFLQIPDLPASWSRTWVALNMAESCLTPDDAARFPEVVDSIFRHFADICAGAAGNLEIQRHIAFLNLRAATWLATRDRLASIHAFRKAWTTEPNQAARAAGKLAALLILGNSSRLLHKKWNQLLRRFWLRLPLQQ